MLATEIQRTEARLGELEADADALRSTLAAVAVRRFVGSGVDPLPLLSDMESFNDREGSDVLYSVAVGSAVADEDVFAATIEQVEDERQTLAAQKAEAEQLREQSIELQQRAEDEVVRLEEIEEQRLQDEAVQRELDRQRRERAAREAAEAAAAQAAADAIAQQQADDQQTQQQALVQAAGGDIATPVATNPAPAGDNGGGGGGNSASSGGGGGAAIAPVATPAPTPAPTTTSPPAPAPVTSGMICPVAGPTAYADTWGAPRSGGRSHQGVDMISPAGTTLVAVESGSVAMKTNNLGGNVVWLTGNSGTRYYYAHLSAWEGGSRSVSQGDVIGYVGATGNAGVNHLHFEVHPGGGAAVNPYPFVRAVC